MTQGDEMRWLITISIAAIVIVGLYAGAIVAANRGVDIIDLAWLPGATHLPEGLTSCERSPRFQSAFREYENAAKQVKALNYRDASQGLDRGLADLGNSYESKWPVFDDTGEHLGVAHMYEHMGKIELAVREKCSVLRDRLETCGEIKQGNKIYHLGPLPSRC